MNKQDYVVVYCEKRKALVAKYTVNRVSFDMILTKAGQPDANGDVYTEIELRRQASVHPKRERRKK